MHDGTGFPLISTEYGEPTVAELQSPGLTILATCHCGHHRQLDPRKVCIAHATPVSMVGAVLTCSKCRQRGLDTRPSRVVSAAGVRGTFIPAAESS